MKKGGLSRVLLLDGDVDGLKYHSHYKHCEKVEMNIPHTEIIGHKRHENLMSTNI